MAYRTSLAQAAQCVKAEKGGLKNDIHFYFCFLHWEDPTVGRSNMAYRTSLAQGARCLKAEKVDCKKDIYTLGLACVQAAPPDTTAFGEKSPDTTFFRPCENLSIGLRSEDRTWPTAPV